MVLFLRLTFLFLLVVFTWWTFAKVINFILEHT